MAKEDNPRLQEFNLQRPVEGATQSQTIKVQVPLLSLVPIPSLCVENVLIDFQMEVTTTETSKETADKEENI